MSIIFGVTHIYLNQIIKSKLYIKSETMGRNKKKNQKKQAPPAEQVEKEDKVLLNSFSSKNIKVSNFEDEEEEQAELDFDYPVRRLLVLKLIRLIPPPQKSLKLDLRKKTVRGDKSKCKDYMKLIQVQCEKFVMKKVSFINEENLQEVDYKLEEHEEYKCKVFRMKKIYLAMDDLAKQYGLKNEIEEYKPTIGNITDKIMLVWVLKEYEQECLKMITDILDRVTEDTSKTSSQQKIQNKKGKDSDSELQIEEDHSEEEQIEDNAPSFYTKTQKAYKVEMQSKPKNKYQAKRNSSPKASKPSNYATQAQADEKEEDSRTQKNEDAYHRGNRDGRRRQRYMVLQKQIPKAYFNKQDFITWCKRNKVLEPNDVVVDDVYDEQNEYLIAYRVIVSSLRQDFTNKKKEQVNMYLNFQTVVVVDSKNVEAKEELYEKYSLDSDCIKIQVIKGYKPIPKPDENEEKQIRFLINKRFYTEKYTNKNKEKFECFFIEGIKPLVERYRDEITKDINNIPESDSKEQIFIAFPQISKYIRDCLPLQQKIQEAIHETSKMFKDIFTIIEIKFVKDEAKVSVNVKFDKQEEFKSRANIFKQTTPKSINLCKIEFKNKFDKNIVELIKDDIVVKDITEKGMILIQTTKNTSNTMSFISDLFKKNNQIDQKQFQFQGKHLRNKLEQFLKELIQTQQFSGIKFVFKEKDSNYILHLIGPNAILEEVFSKIEDQIKEITNKTYQFIESISKKQAQIIEKDKQFQQKILKQEQITLHVNENARVEAKIIIQSPKNHTGKKTILIKKEKHFDFMPLGSRIIFTSMAEVQSIKTSYLQYFALNLKKMKSTTYEFKEPTRNYLLMYSENATIESLMELAFGINNQSKTVGILLPHHNKAYFLKNLISFLYNSEEYRYETLNIVILQTFLRSDIKSLVNIKESQDKKAWNPKKTETKWYVSDGQQNFFYSDSGNRKIQQAIKEGKSKVYLVNEDINLVNKSHTIDFANKIITHNQSGKQHKIYATPTSIRYEISNQVFQFSKALFDAVMKAVAVNPTGVFTISIGAYEINLQTNEQINLFSGFTRKLQNTNVEFQKKVNQIEENAQVQYGIIQPQLIYSFQDSNAKQLQCAIDKVKKYFADHLTEKDFEMKECNAEMKKEIQRYCNENDLKCSIKKNTVTVTAYDKDYIRRFQSYLPLIERLGISGINKNIEFPKEWEKQQTDIQIFTVKPNTVEFANVQNQFKFTNIKQLIRIQNKITYTKYEEEKQFLTKQNNGKVPKQMRLFHGTKKTKPSKMYEDREESFNVNYSSDTNLLGRGVYFAQTARYSNDYRHEDGKYFSMLLCQVIVGDSMKCPSHSGDYRDTEVKNHATGLKYESMTDFLNGSNVYAVYKNRRAYPLYLIKYSA